MKLCQNCNAAPTTSEGATYCIDCRRAIKRTNCAERGIPVDIEHRIRTYKAIELRHARRDGRADKRAVFAEFDEEMK